ncbi:HAD family hydrolase [Streptomyces spectabilis]|uniref:HAD family hydrolase n=1 Tax=Streptomyces spectabilis TaxID=68270 RepID=A0A5P2X7I4_STRST|nr:HAD hydrolase-like protein [Streptomyces spectabilis]MBB5103115.1 phosphoglycolate phosphatase-like HAD superfamily hydrolase [Streptomyces spectabilis]MCI3902310.1 HAD hydrolase-like protein [Streptomyces spectabilis]QEV59674.1 HAD family hydrolase [Streptomyces spectabilis]GGV14690.1 haloacid dehalogenase [Streptomyces spectabilis]
MPELVLWDIDHTLMATRGLGRELWAQAFHKATGVELREQASVTGSTERVILRETARLHDLSYSDELFEPFASALGAVHVQRAADLREHGHALPGAAAVLARLANQGVRQTVVTGNVRAAAEVKLAVFGLDAYLLLEDGAYAEDGEERTELLRAALNRSTVRPEDAVFLGDTPADVEGGLDVGVRTVAVATGCTSAAQLRGFGADAVLESLEDTDAVLAAIA